MSKFRDFLKAGHWPTLFMAFLYFDFCFAVWVMNGAMAPFISAKFGLSAAEKGLMISVPIIAGALMRFPLGLFAQYIGRKNAALVEMGTIILAMLYGYFFADTYTHVIIMGIMLGVAGASFGVALSLGGGWFPPKYKGLAIGIAGAGNSGAVIAQIFAPPLAMSYGGQEYGWQYVYGYAALFMMVPFVLMIFLAKEPPDREKKSLGGYLKVLVEKDAWIFNISYILTFGGYIGLTNFLPTFFHDQYGVKLENMGLIAAGITVLASISRVLGGWIADRFGGVRVMVVICLLTAVASALLSLIPPIGIAVFLLSVLFLALGAGNGSTFQLVPHRWVATSAIAMSLIGEVGALGGGLIPNAMGQSKQHFDTFAYGFLMWTFLAAGILVMYLGVRRRWTSTWVGVGGKPLTTEERKQRMSEGVLVH